MPASEATESGFDADYGRLVALLPDLEARLRDLDRDFWADWVADASAKITSRDSEGLAHMRRAYGGMGSISDHFFPPEVDRLLSEVYDLTNSLGYALQAQDDAFQWPPR